MKKQILLLTFFVAAVLAGSNVFGQNTEEDALTAVPTFCTTAVPLTCGAGNELEPAPGVEYTYTISVTGTPNQVLWFVTDSSRIAYDDGTGKIILQPNRDSGDGTGDYILNTTAVYNNTANTDVAIPITWKSFDGINNEVLLVAYALDAAGCTDNVEVYRIQPKYNFTLDIAGILDEGTEGATECVSPVQSATYDGTNLNVDYGTNYVYFAVNAANWQTSWMPDNFTAVTDGASTVTVDGWAYPADAATGGTWNTIGTDEVLASNYASNVNGFIGAAGECIIVRVRVDHAALTENITDENINLTVNGEMINPETTAYDGAYPDLDEPASGTDCIDDLTTDNADYIITPRPDINEVDPTPFENKVPRD